MWDNNALLQLLNKMPKKLNKENLEKLQMVIDADKYKNSLISGFDLCGMYAPFCRDCKKTSIYPCAISYINMLKAGGSDIEIDAKPVNAVENVVAPAPVNVEQQVEQIEEAQVQELAVSVAEEVTEISEDTFLTASVTDSAAEQELSGNLKYETEQVIPHTLQDVAATTPRTNRRIRIAIARKKLN